MRGGGAGLLVHCRADWRGGLGAVLLGHGDTLLPVGDGAHLSLHHPADILALRLVEAPAVLPLLGGHLHQLAGLLLGQRSRDGHQEQQ